MTPAIGIENPLQLHDWMIIVCECINIETAVLFLTDANPCLICADGMAHHGPLIYGDLRKK